MSYSITDANGTRILHPLTASVQVSLGSLMTLRLTLPWSEGLAIELPATIDAEGITSAVDDISENYPYVSISGSGFHSQDMRYSRIDVTSTASTAQEWFSELVELVEGAEARFNGTSGLSDNPKTGNLGNGCYFQTISTLAGCYGREMAHYTSGDNDIISLCDKPSSYDFSPAVYSLVSTKNPLGDYNEACLQKISSCTSTSTAVATTLDTRGYEQGIAVTMQGSPWLEGTYTAVRTTPWGLSEYAGTYEGEQLREWTTAWDGGNTLPAERLLLAPCTGRVLLRETIDREDATHQVDVQSVVDEGPGGPTPELIASHPELDYTTGSSATDRVYGIYGAIPHKTGVWYVYETPTYTTEYTYPTYPCLYTTHEQSDSERVTRKEWGESWSLEARSGGHYWTGPYPGRNANSSTYARYSVDTTHLVPQSYPWCHLTRTLAPTAWHTESTSDPGETETGERHLSYYIPYQHEGYVYNYGVYKQSTTTRGARSHTDRYVTGMRLSEAQYCGGFDPSSIPTIFPGSTFPTMPQSTEEFFDPSVSSEDDINTRVMGMGVVGQYEYTVSTASYPIELMPTSVQATVTSHDANGGQTRVITEDTDFDLSVLGLTKIPKSVVIAETDEHTWSLGTATARAYVLTSSVWGSKSNADAVRPSILWNVQRKTVCDATSPIVEPPATTIARIGTGACLGGKNGQLTSIAIDLTNRQCTYELKVDF